MKKAPLTVIVGLCTAAVLGVWAAPAGAQSAEVKEKPQMYSYVAYWAIPRARWAEMDKAVAADQKILDKGIAAGTLVAYGDDTTLIHQAEGFTHDNWWSSMSMAGLLNTLDEIYKSGTATSPVLGAATKHEDSMLVSRYYNWHAGSWKGAYVHTALYKLKPTAPDDALDTIAKTLIVPMYEKLLAAGTILEYEVDEEAIHTASPDNFSVTYFTATAEGQDKVAAAVREAFKANPLAGPATGAMFDYTAHRDYLARANVVFK